MTFPFIFDPNAPLAPARSPVLGGVAWNRRRLKDVLRFAGAARVTGANRCVVARTTYLSIMTSGKTGDCFR